MDENCKVPWKSIETALVQPNRLQDLPYTDLKGKKFKVKFGTIIANCLTVWKKAEKLFETVPKFHKLSPLWNNTNILTGKKPFTCPLWVAKGICMLVDIYGKDGLYSFNNLQTLFDIPGSSFFLYLRLRSAMKAYGVPWNTSLPSHPLAGLFDPEKESRGLVSQIYNCLLKNVCELR